MLETYTIHTGNEADIVLVSIVRSRDPGFLRSEQRMNVMLTRCRRGLVIVSSRSFLLGPGRSTLVGKLARGRPWFESTAITEQPANLLDAWGEHAPVESVMRHPNLGTEPLLVAGSVHSPPRTVQASYAPSGVSSVQTPFEGLQYPISLQNFSVYDQTFLLLAARNACTRGPLYRTVFAVQPSLNVSSPRAPVQMLGVTSQTIGRSWNASGRSNYPGL